MMVGVGRRETQASEGQANDGGGGDAGRWLLSGTHARFSIPVVLGVSVQD